MALIQNQLGRALPSNLHKIASRKLDMLDAAQVLDDLLFPGNHLESLKGDLQGKHSIKINLQWKIVFRWVNQGADEVEIIDYH